MKKYLPLFILFISFCFSQDRVNVNNLVKYGEKYFKGNDDRPFNGIVFDLSKSTGNMIAELMAVCISTRIIHYHQIFSKIVRRFG